MQKVSIIIPVYNVQPYLDECLESVFCQSYDDWECILVDDGSTDGSGSICDAWAEKDERFMVVHQQNQGVSASRNNGLKIAKGEFVAFIDSDDWVDADYIKDMVAAFPQSDDAALVLSAYNVFWTENGRYELLPALANEVVHLDKTGIEQTAALIDQFRLMGPWCKLYKRSIIEQHGIEFPLGISYGEDLLFNVAYLHHTKQIVTIPSVNYHYRRLQGSLSLRIIPNYWLLNYTQWVALTVLFQEKGMFEGSLENVLYKRLWGIIYDSIFLSQKLHKRFIDHYKYIRTILSIPEISDADFIKTEYNCAPWIKTFIRRRMTLLMTGVVMIKG